MPFTPFHFGPGLLLKSAAPRGLSATGFAAANVAIDIETLVHIVRGEWPVHRWAHTFLGAGAIGVLSGLALAAVAGRLTSRDPLPAPLRGELSRGPLMVGSILGGLTHPLLDGLMHRDIRPFLPFSAANPLLDAIPVGVLISSCVAAGLLGLAILYSRRPGSRAGA